jgi:hypothetical protein
MTIENSEESIGFLRRYKILLAFLGAMLILAAFIIIVMASGGKHRKIQTVVENDPASGNARPGSMNFLRKPKVKFALVGAILALATFVIKDMLRDDQREIADAIDSTRRIFVVGRGIDGLSFDVADLSTFLRSNFPTGPSTPATDPFKPFRPRDERAEAIVRRLNNEATYAQQGLFLCDVVPGSEEVRKELNEKIVYFKNAASELQRLENKVIPPDRSTQAYMREFARYAEVTMTSSHAQELLDHSEELRKKLDDLLDRAEILEHHATWWYKFAKRWSIPLFLISLLTSFYCTLTGIELLKQE